ncbi:hypothetical protein ACXO9Y_06795, partial [Lactobacillus delbrueckii subsp. bulgaricus]
SVLILFKRLADSDLLVLASTDPAIRGNIKHILTANNIIFIIFSFLRPYQKDAPCKEASLLIIQRMAKLP